MPIFQSGTYQVKPEAVEKVKKAIEELVVAIHDHEPGTRFYIVWQEKDHPTRFAHFYMFADAAAAEAHAHSEEVKRFEAVYRPELVGGDVKFTDYIPVATDQK